MTPEQLIARLEAASGPDEELDVLVARGFNRRWAPYPEPYTASIDAALTLVPEGWSWSIVERRTMSFPPQAQCWTREEGSTVFGDANTPALALVIAALKARQQP